MPLDTCTMPSWRTLQLKDKQKWIVGQEVLADWNGSWYAARIEEVMDPNSGNVSEIFLNVFNSCHTL